MLSALLREKRFTEEEEEKTLLKQLEANMDTWITSYTLVLLPSKHLFRNNNDNKVSISCGRVMVMADPPGLHLEASVKKMGTSTNRRNFQQRSRSSP